MVSRDMLLLVKSSGRWPGWHERSSGSRIKEAMWKVFTGRAGDRNMAYVRGGEVSSAEAS